MDTVGKVLPLSHQPFGAVSNKFRRFCARKIVSALGENVRIESGAVLHKGVKIGSDTLIGPDNLISPETIIGNKVLLAPEVLIYTSNHKFNPEKLAYEGYTEIEKVIIGDNVWIGARCIILPGVTIGEGSTIGAGSIVTKNIPPYSLAAGNPARVIKSLI